MHLLQFTGLSGAGKTTIARSIKTALEAQGQPVAIIDGDVYRKNLCADLGFSAAHRQENIRRLGAVAHGFVCRGSIAIVAAINPYESARRHMAHAYGARTVWLDCPLEVLQQRDTKGLYRRAALPEGHHEKLYDLTGVNDPYERPAAPDLILHTGKESVDISVTRLLDFIRQCPPTRCPEWLKSE